MIKDIVAPEVGNVALAIARENGADGMSEWKVYLINKNALPLENTLVGRSTYGEGSGEKQNTSILRQLLETVAPQSSTFIEPIDPRDFHLSNAYWVSYYIGTQIYEKRFVFRPDAIRHEKFSFIPELAMEGVLHS